MRSIRHVASAVAGFATMFAAAPLFAQAPEASGTVFHVSPYVGYMVFGDTLLLTESGNTRLNKTEKKLFVK